MSLLSAARSSLYAARCTLSPAFLYAVRCPLFTALLFTALLYAVPCSLSPAYAADFTIRPSITVSEEYNDNVFETNVKTTDYITRFMPGIAFAYSAPFWEWNLAYNYDYRYYAKNSRNGDDTHNLNTTGLVRLIDDFLLLDINDTYSRVSLDISRDRTQESLIANQSDSNNFTASPYLQFHPVKQATIKTGYRYTNVYFDDTSGIDRRDHVGFIDAAYELSPKWTLNANHTYTHENSRAGYDRHTSYIGGRYAYSERSFINAQGGYTINDLKNGEDSNKPYWNAGITHYFDHTSIVFSTAVQYPIDPLSGTTRETDYTLAVNRELARGAVGLNVSYSEFSGTEIDVEKRYGAGITARHELAENLVGSLTCSVDKYEHRDTNSYSRRILLTPSLSYTLPHEFTIGLNYTFIDSYSPVTLTDRYQVNRVSLELRKSFGREVERIRLATSDH
jgi:hypothetical protein